jgi:hypothetical protein
MAALMSRSADALLPRPRQKRHLNPEKLARSQYIHRRKVQDNQAEKSFGEVLEVPTLSGLWKDDYNRSSENSRERGNIDRKANSTAVQIF